MKVIKKNAILPTNKNVFVNKDTEKSAKQRKNSRNQNSSKLNFKTK